MLVGQVAVPRSLIVALRERRIDHAVLLVEHDIARDQPGAEFENGSVGCQFQEGGLVGERQADGVVFVDGLQCRCAAMLAAMALAGSLEGGRQVSECGVVVAAVDDPVAETADRFRDAIDVTVRDRLPDDAIPLV